MGQALYRKYRSKSFSEVVGQDHITKTLQNAIKAGKISHAYLFTGPRGIGKTSVARILAHEVNSLPYTDESIHLDIIEIDAASNRRIDEIRDLRDRVRIAPTSAKYKVYIIDEVHMLTREAFNALLKTLEEPPAHCIFILATTEAHKLPETIISRTQRFEFKTVGTAQAASHLKFIARQEKLKISQQALELLAEFGGGSFRDSISYLDQLSSYGKEISEEDVRELLGLPAAREIESLLSDLADIEPANLLSRLKSIEGIGVSAKSVAVAVSDKLRQNINQGQLEVWQVELLKQLLSVSASSRPQETLEIVMLEACINIQASGAGTAPKIKPAQSEQNTPEIRQIPSVPKAQLAELAVEPAQELKETSDFSLAIWDDVVELSKKRAASIYTALRLAEPRYSNGVLVLVFQFPLHQKKLDQAKNKDLVSRIIKEICGADILVEPIVEKTTGPAEYQPQAQNSKPASIISNIFGNTEILET